MDNYAQILLKEMKFEAASTHFKLAWDSKKKIVGEMNHMTAISLDHWAISTTLASQSGIIHSYMYLQSELDVLSGALLKAIETFEKTVGKDNNFTWKTYNNLSGCFFKFGNFSEAQKHITICNKTFDTTNHHSKESIFSQVPNTLIPI